MSTKRMQMEEPSVPANNYRRLAAAVLMTAVRDAQIRTNVIVRTMGQRSTWEIKRDALEFLGAPNDVLQHWCDVADISPRAFICKFESAMFAARRLEARSLRARPAA